jgi:hypothetical protein
LQPELRRANPMNAKIRTLLLVLALSVLSACAHLPRAPHPSEQLTFVRTQYLSDHPDGRFNDKIERGEIAKGMGEGDVLASWGVPDERLRDKHHPREESWFYVERDEYSADYVVYEIVFEDGDLDCWYMRRETAGSGGLFNSGAASYAALRDARESRSNASPSVPGASTVGRKK